MASDRHAYECCWQKWHINDAVVKNEAVKVSCKHFIVFLSLQCQKCQFHQKRCFLQQLFDTSTLMAGVKEIWRWSIAHRLESMVYTFKWLCSVFCALYCLARRFFISSLYAFIIQLPLMSGWGGYILHRPVLSSIT